MGSTERNLLSAQHDLDSVRDALANLNSWRRYPKASDREAWKTIPEKLRTRFLADGEERLTESWELLRASTLLDFPRHGNRTSYQDPSFQRRGRLHDLALAECIEGKGRFLDAIADGVWLTCEETWWGFPAHLQEQKVGADLPDITDPTVDLGVGEVAALLAWIDHVLGEQLDTVSKLIRPRIKIEIDRQLLTPALERDDYWWMGWQTRHHPVNNWNPWINSNWIACALLIESDPERRARAIHKILRSLDVFINHQPNDGGCDEGPVYWGRAGASLFDCLELLHHATEGKISLFDHALIKNTGRYIMSAHIDGDWLVNFADAAANGMIDGELVQRYGRQTDDQALANFGSWVTEHQAERPHSHIRSLNRTLAGLFDTEQSEGEAAPPPPLLRDVWLPDLQFMAARSQAGGSKGLFLAAKGGHNAESHNHNDIGTFVAYLNGAPLLIDVGVETYSAKTFSPQRYEIWTMQSQWHNLPTINGTMQLEGREYAARNLSHNADDAGAILSLDIAGSYPDSAAINRYTRNYSLDRNGPLTITDDYELSEAREPIVWNFMMLCAPEIITDGQVRLQNPDGDAARLIFAIDQYDSTIEKIVLEDPQLNTVWGDQVYRFQLTAKHTPIAGRHEFIITIEK